MTTYIVFLGRQPALGLAELEAHFGAPALERISAGIALLHTQEKPTFDRFGGIMKVAKLLTNLDYTDWNRLVRYIQTSLPDHLQYIPEGKITFGLSVYGIPAKPLQINAAALSIKKVIKQAGRSVRIVPNNEPELGTAQILHNKLTSPTGIELNLLCNDSQTLLSQTVWVQDIDAYRERDQERPMRDARVGMLPPKLAQIIINLAVADEPASNGGRILDPFCGTGVVLQEATLMGYDAYGSDLEPRMVEYTQKNMEWLHEIGLVNAVNKDGSYWDEYYALEQADATAHHWSKSWFNHIACETYLGRPFAQQPDPQTLQKVISDVNIIHKKFLQNVATQTKPGFRMCIAVPAWHTKNGIKHLPVLDQLAQLAYNRISFVHAGESELIYHREGQVVGRELVVLTRK